MDRKNKPQATKEIIGFEHSTLVAKDMHIRILVNRMTSRIIDSMWLEEFITDRDTYYESYNYV